MKDLSRRDLIKLGGMAGGSLLFGQSVSATETKAPAKDPHAFHPAATSRLAADSKVVHSVCLGCNGRCGIRFSVANGRIEQASGNPYHPYNNQGQPVAYDTGVETTLPLPSPVCAKAQDVTNYVYNPHRILTPLKRSGARGSGKFRPISWQQLIDEVSQGGNLFSELGETRHIKGLQELDSDQPANPSDPGLGPLRNSFVFMTGRLQSGRKEFIDRFVKDAFGSQNRIGHTDICGLGFRMGNYTLTEGAQVELKADPWGCEYMLVFGANIYEALQPGLNAYGATVAKRGSRGDIRFTIVDPRAQNAATHAETWLAVKPGQDGALAMGMIRWIIDNNRHNQTFLSAPNPAAAKALGHPTYTNATHLVITSPEHARYGQFLRPSDLNALAQDPDKEPWLVMTANNDRPQPYADCAQAILEGEYPLTGADGTPLKVATAFTLMKQAAMEHSLEEYASFSGLKVQQIVDTAREFTAHGTKAAVCQYHGAGNYSNGTYASYPIALLNVLIGSIDRRGGYMKGGGGCGKWDKGPYELKNFAGKKKRQGPKISRECFAYEKTAEYRQQLEKTGSGYPSKRPWFPFSKGGLSVEALGGIDQSYPYQCNLLMTYFYNPVYSTPGGYRFKDTLLDPDKVPLHVSIDIGINESNLYADYIVPDITYTEGHYGWLTPHAPALKFTGLRVPCIEPQTGTTADGRAFSLETFLIDLAEACKLPGFGDNAIAGPNNQRLPLHTAEDFYLRAYANMATGAKLPTASPAEQSFVETNYPSARFKQAVAPEHWSTLCYALARGGIFVPYDKVFDGEQFKHGLGRVVLYNETLAATRNTLSGERMPGTIRYMPPTTANGELIAEVDRDFPFHVITYKMNVHTQSRTTWHKWSMEIFPKNFIAIHPQAAATLGLAEHDEVVLRSRSCPEGIRGTLHLTQTIRPDCLGISFHYGHSQLGASQLEIADAAKVFVSGEAICDGKATKADPTLGTGTNPNMVGRLDEGLANTPVVDVLTGIPDFSNTRVTISRV
jgi:tetrathionate reductase subunit A